MLEMVWALGSTAVVLALRLGYRWCSTRTEVQLAGLRQQGMTARIQALPPGSVLIERCPGEELRVELAPVPDAGGSACG